MHNVEFHAEYIRQMYPIHPLDTVLCQTFFNSRLRHTPVCLATENVSLMGLYLFPKGEINMDSSDHDQAVNITPSQMLVKVSYSTIHFSTVLKRVDCIHKYGQNYAFCMYICTRISVGWAQDLCCHFPLQGAGLHTTRF